MNGEKEDKEFRKKSHVPSLMVADAACSLLNPFCSLLCTINIIIT